MNEDTFVQVIPLANPAKRRSPGVLGEKAFTDQKTFHLKKLKKVKKQLDDDE